MAIIIIGIFWSVKYLFPEFTNEVIRHVIRIESTIIAFVLNLFHGKVYLYHHDDYIISSISLDGINYMSHEQNCTGLKETVYTLAAVPFFSNSLSKFIKNSILMVTALMFLNFIRSIVLIESYDPYAPREIYDTNHYIASIALVIIMTVFLVYKISKSD